MARVVGMSRESISTTGDPSDQLRPLDTLAVTGGRPARGPDAPLNSPIVPASSFGADGTFEYARYDAPTTSALEEVLGAMDGGLATVFASGMAAATAAMDLIPHGSIVVAPISAYTAVGVRLRELDADGRISLRVVDVDDTPAVRAAVDGAWLLWLESVTNPMLHVADLPECIAAAHDAGALVLVDSTFATPVLQQPLRLGADIVMHAVTKAIAGHSDLLQGALITRDAELHERIRSRRIILGAAPSAFDCFLALRGLRTLPLRMRHAQASAQELAQRLAGHPAIRRVRYPGFGSMISIELTGGVPAADSLCRSVRVWMHATSLGGVESLLERRRRWPAESPTVPDDLVRMSVGIEDVEDLWADLEQALQS